MLTFVVKSIDLTFSADYHSFGGGRKMIKTTLRIDGMACTMCEAHIQETIRKNFDVESVKANHKKAIAEVISRQELDEEKLRKVIGETGYDYLSKSSEPYEKKGLFGLFR